MNVQNNPLRLLNTYPKQLKLMFYGMLISAVGSSMIWPFLMIYVRRQANLPLTQAASLTSIQATAAVLATFIAGPIADRVGRKWVMVVSLAGNGLMYFFMSGAHSYMSFAILMALTGAFNPLYRVGSDATVADLVEPERRPDAYALMRLSNNAGIAIGPMIGGTVAALSFIVPFYFASAGMVFYSLLLAFFARETMPKRILASEKIPNPFTGYLEILRDTKFMTFIGAFILTQMCATTIWILMPVYATEKFGIPMSSYAIIPTTNALMVVFIQIFITRITKKYRPLPVMMVGTMFYALGVGSVALGRSLAGFWVSIVIMTIGELILMPTSSTYVANLAPTDMRGRYMSVAGLTWYAAQGIAPVFGGYLNDRFAPLATWYGGFSIGMLGLLGFYILSRRDRALRPTILPGNIPQV